MFKKDLSIGMYLGIGEYVLSESYQVLTKFSLIFVQFFRDFAGLER